MAGDSGLEPGPGPAGLVEHRGVGDLLLGHRERPVEPGPAILNGQRIGHHGHHPGKQVPYMAGAQAGADTVCRDGVLDGPEPVVEGLKGDPRLGQLAFGPLVPVGVAPQGVGGIGAQPQRCRPPLVVGEVEIPVVRHRRLAPPHDVGMAGAVSRV